MCMRTSSGSVTWLAGDGFRRSAQVRRQQPGRHGLTPVALVANIAEREFRVVGGVAEVGVKAGRTDLDDYQITRHLLEQLMLGHRLVRTDR